MDREPKRVIQIFGSLNRGGAESRMMDVYRNIDRDKIQFDFIKMNDEENHFDSEILSMGGNIYEITNPRKSIISHLKELYNIFKIKGPFIAIHSHTSYHSAIALFIAYLTGIKYRVCHARTTGSKQKKGIALFITMFVSRIFINLFSTKRLAISKDSAKFLYGSLIGEKGSVIVPNAIDLRKYHDVYHTSSSNVKEILGIPQDSIVIGHVGRFSSMKNHAFLLEIIKEIIKTLPNAYLVCVGDGELRKEIEKTSHEMKINEHVKFLGVREDIPFIMRAFDVFVFPSLWEGLGGVVIEAQASGLNCVVSNTIPKETDLGLGLVEYISLSDNQKWIHSIKHAIKGHRPDFDTIEKAFELKDFTLERSCKSILEAYGSNQNYFYKGNDVGEG